MGIPYIGFRTYLQRMQKTGKSERSYAYALFKTQEVSAVYGASVSPASAHTRSCFQPKMVPIYQLRRDERFS